MAYSELIKNFEKIRDYMREFYVYGFKSRDAYTKKSARSYDNERRRIESWLGDYMGFRQTPEGKNVFISVDSRAVPFNPLYQAWKAKSFTDNDITLHFYILELLSSGKAISVRDIVEGITVYLEEFNTPFEPDESTVRKKLKEYEQLGILVAEKQGRENLYRLSTDRIDMQSWADAVTFFSEEAPLGVIGSYLLDKPMRVPEYLSFKHHYLLHSLDAQIIYEIICAINDKCCIDIVNFSTRKSEEHEHRVYPLKFYISTQSGREYLLAYHYKFRKPMFFRLDGIRKISRGPFEKNHEKYEAWGIRFDENLWGVSTGFEYSMDHVEITIHVDNHEDYIADRLEREKRHGRIERIDDQTYRFIADVYDAGELVTWARTFTGRVISFESTNKHAVKRFYDDMDVMYSMYGGDPE